MKLTQVLNTYPKLYINVVPPRDHKISTGSLIATVMRQRANDQGYPNDYEDDTTQICPTWPNHRWDRRVGDNIGTEISQKARKLRKKYSDSLPRDLDTRVNQDVVER
jgi:hypothetical protein